MSWGAPQGTKATLSDESQPVGVLLLTRAMYGVLALRLLTTYEVCWPVNGPEP